MIRFLFVRMLLLLATVVFAIAFYVNCAALNPAYGCRPDIAASILISALLIYGYAIFYGPDSLSVWWVATLSLAAMIITHLVHEEKGSREFAVLAVSFLSPTAALLCVANRGLQKLLKRRKPVDTV